MDAQRFSRVTRTLTGLPSRREVLRGLAGAGLGLGLGATRIPDPAAAKKRQPRKPKPNAYGCLEVGDACKNANQCCSGICTEKGRKRKCRAHGTGTCKQDKPGVCTAPINDLPKLGCNVNCWCFRTTAGSNFCSKGPRTSGQEDCTDCKKDADCLALGYPPGSACAFVGRGNCNGWCDSGMACLVPCGVDFPEPPSGM